MKIKLSRKQAQALRLAAAFVDTENFSDELEETLLEAYEVLEESNVGLWIDSYRIWKR